MQTMDWLRAMLVRTGWALLLAASVSAQELATLAFTDSKPTDRVRPPLPAPPVMITLPGGGKIPLGIRSGIPGEPPLRLSIVSFDRTQYSLGQEFLCVIRVENPEKYPTSFPRRASLGEIEPADPQASYEYRPLEIWLLLEDSQSRAIHVRLWTLYGSAASPGSEVELRQGQWINLKGKIDPCPRTPICASRNGVSS